jgi:hypothetical protein
MRPFFIPHLKDHESNGVQIVGGARPARWRKRPPTEAALLCGLRDHPSVTHLMRNGFVTAVLNGTL